MSEDEDAKRIIIVRHAKSSWANEGLTDFDRPLNDRGKRDAPIMGNRLKQLGIQPDLIISSTAKRARQTAKKLSAELDYKNEDILLLDKLYHCHPDTFEEIIYSIEDNIKTVMIVAHNPGITLFVNSLSYNFSSENIPTCGIVGAEFSAKNWNEFDRVEKQVVIFEYPQKAIMSPSTDSSQNIDILADLFETHFKEKPDSIVSLPISGSDRRYYRLRKDNKVAVGTFNDNVAENNSFFYFAELLRKHGVNVPEIYAIGKERRFYLQQDLGDVSLFDLLASEGHTAEVKEYYKKSVEQLVKAQWMAGRECNFDQCFASKSFDEKAIMGDLMYFKYYFADLQKIPYDKQLLMEEMEQLSRELGRIQPQTLMYRDFQSRNIMVHEGQVYFIDFQGAMQGPPQYDLASLLWQAKAKLPDAWKDELMNSYVSAMDEIKIARVEEIHFRKGYLQFVLLRMLQVLGAYGFKGLLEHKPHFISSISPALANLQSYLSDNPQVPNYQELRALLEGVCSDDIQNHYKQPEKSDTVKLKVDITSFSYKQNGMPKDDTDHGGGYVFDCRGIKNPGRYKPYKHLSGLDASVQNFLDRETRMPDFISQVYGLVSINIDDYISRDFDYLSINFGCTGGQHRSVYAAVQLAAYLKGKYNIPVTLTHSNKDNWVTEPD